MGSFDYLCNYEGSVYIDGKKASSEEIKDIELLSKDDISIELVPKSAEEKIKYRITVRAWMANDSGNLDFHQRWNKGIPMPAREMVGELIGETPGMKKMKLYTLDGKDVWEGYVSKVAIISFEEIRESEYNKIIKGEVNE